MANHITEQRVLDTRDSLPAFPLVVLQILQTLDDPEGSLSLLSRQVETDAVIAARVLSLCNRAATSQGRTSVSNVFTALSLVGMARVREAAVTSNWPASCRTLHLLPPWSTTGRTAWPALCVAWKWPTTPTSR